jgi:mRNA interferase HigB
MGATFSIEKTPLLPPWERATVYPLRIFNRATLVAFWTKHKDAEGPLRLWFSIVDRANWTGPSELRAAFRTADFLANNRVIFDIKGNRYRIVTQIKYAPLCLVYIRFIGTHAEYAEIDAQKVWALHDCTRR